MRSLWCSKKAKFTTQELNSVYWNRAPPNPPLKDLFLINIITNKPKETDHMNIKTMYRQEKCAEISEKLIVLIEEQTKAMLCSCLDFPREWRVNAYLPSSEETILINIRPIWLSLLNPEGRIFFRYKRYVFD